MSTAYFIGSEMDLEHAREQSATNPNTTFFIALNDGIARSIEKLTTGNVSAVCLHKLLEKEAATVELLTEYDLDILSRFMIDNELEAVCYVHSEKDKLAAQIASKITTVVTVVSLLPSLGHHSFWTEKLHTGMSWEPEIKETGHDFGSRLG